LRKTVSALCRSGKENKQKLFGKDVSTGSYESHDSLGLRAGWSMREILSHEDIKKSTFKRSLANLSLLEDLLMCILRQE
jgi:hypothetical protein